MGSQSLKIPKISIPDFGRKKQFPGKKFGGTVPQDAPHERPAHTCILLTLDELIQTTCSRASLPVIENLLYTGAYILAGAPKIGKSFLVAQIAHHVSTGQDLWGYKVHQGTVLYLALEDDESRMQSRMFRMFGVDEQAPSTSPPAPK